MSINAADLLVNVRAETAKAKKQIQELDDEIDKLGGTFNVVGDAAKRFGTAAAVGFGALATQAVAGGILQLGAALAPLAGLVAALPGVAAGAGAAFGTLALGMYGVGDAVKALISGDMKKLAEAMAKLSPNAQAFIRSLQKIGPAFSALRLDVQDALFRGLGKSVETLAKRYIPALRGPMLTIASGFNAAALGVAAFLSRADNVMDVRSIFTATGVAMQSLKPILTNIVAGLLDFATVGASLLPEMAKSVEGLSEKFRAWADNARRTGQIEEWIRNAGVAAKDLGGIFLNIGQIIGTVFQVVPGVGLLAHLKNMTQAVEDFLKSAEGQADLLAFFNGLTMAASAIGPVLAAAFGAFTQGVVPLLANLATAVGPGLTTFLYGMRDALIQLQPSAILLGEAVGTLLTNLTPLLPVVADFIAKLVEFAAPLIENEKLVIALVAAFVGIKVIGGALGIANAAIDLFSSKAVAALARAVAAVATWIGSVIAATATYAAHGAILVGLALAETAKIIATYVARAAGVVASWVVMAVGAAANATLIAAAWVLHSATAAATAVASYVAKAAVVVAQWVVMSAAATLNAAKIVAAWVLHSATAAAIAVASLVKTAILIVAQWALMAARAMVSAGIMAAAWLISMGPIGAVIAAVVGLAVIIYKNWDAIKAKTIAIWNAVAEKVDAAWEAVKSAVIGGVASVIAKVVSLKAQVIAVFNALPAAMMAAGRAAMAGLANGIADAGRAAIDKAREMASAVKDAVTGFFKINSPSKVFHEIGVFTGQGLANGLADMTKAVAQAGASMAAAAVPDVGRGTGLGASAAALTGASTGGTSRTLTVASGAVQLVVQGSITEAAVPQVLDGVDAALRALLGEINGGRIPGRVA